MTEPSKAPPADLSPSELWVALTQTPRPFKVVDFPRADPITGEPMGKVAIWCLTQEEQIAASAEAERVTKKLLKDPQREGEANLGYTTIFSNEATVQVLFRACRNVKDIMRPVFPSASMLRKQLSVDEISVLAVLYMQVQSSVGPIVASMTPEEEKLWIGRLADAGDVFPTASLTLREMEALLLSSAKQLVSFWTERPSAGSELVSGGPDDIQAEPSETVTPADMTADDHVAETS